MTVSIYKNVADTEGVKVDLFSVLTTNKWRHLTDKIRAETNKDKRNRLKQQLLPAFTPSGVFKEHERTDTGLVRHSGYMCIDIDGDDNPHIRNWQAVVYELGKLPEVAFAGLSASANGVFAIIPIQHPERHKEHFKGFQESFKKRGLLIDAKCGNLSRLRFYSYNKKYYINRAAKPYMHLYKEPAKPKYTPAPYMPTMQSDDNDVDALVREIVARGVNIVPNYDAWFNVGSALSNLPNGRELFHKISRVDASKYNYKKCDKQFDSLKPGKGISINTLFYMAKNSGVTLKRKQDTLFVPICNTSTSSETAPLAPISKSVCCEAEDKLEIPFTTPTQQTAAPKPKDNTKICYVAKDGQLYISNPIGDDTFSVHHSVECYNSGKGLPTIIDKEDVDTSEMEVYHMNCITLTITPLQAAYSTKEVANKSTTVDETNMS